MYKDVYSYLTRIPSEAAIAAAYNKTAALTKPRTPSPIIFFRSVSSTLPAFFPLCTTVAVGCVDGVGDTVLVLLVSAGALDTVVPVSELDVATVAAAAVFPVHFPVLLAAAIPFG